MPIVDVANVQQLVDAISDAQPGDEIVLADGTYTLTGIACSSPGMASAPITVRAANRRMAQIRMDSVEGFRVTAPYWTFEGLDIEGVCATDDDCEHAFHVTGAAHHFVLRDSRVRDFNAQLKVNAAMVSGTMTAPDAGLIEGNDIGDTRGRNTANPVTKLNIDTGDDWIVRGNYLHDAQKLLDNRTSYVAFLKSGGKRGLVERNLVICAKDDPTGGTRIGLSFGGGGTGNQFCAPAYDASVPCATEHYDGVMRNNIIVNCSDVGIYLNESANTKLLYNTLIATAGIDFRFMTTTGEAVGNVLAGQIRTTRDQATGTKTNNLEMVPAAMFTSWYADPMNGDLSVIGDVSSLVAAGPARTDVVDDYCARTRPSSTVTLGALEHSLGACATTMPPPGGDAGTGQNDGATPSDSGGCCETGGGRSSTFLATLVAILALRRRP
ncbi:MAG: chondroitinase-B domain-containing protein [Kofleriaceae bacterium]